jgi:hypothetical protein
VPLVALSEREQEELFGSDDDDDLDDEALDELEARLQSTGLAAGQ